MKLYNFKRLIDKYSVDFVLIAPSEGKYEGGIYVDGEGEQIKMRGTIVPMSMRKVYQLGGNYSAQDKELYTVSHIDDALLGGKVIYKGRTYSIEEETDYSDYADAYHYLLRKEGIYD